MMHGRQAFTSFATFILLMGQVGPLAGQRDSSFYRSDGFITFPLEAPVINTEAISSILSSSGMPGYKYPKVSIGIGLQGRINRHIFAISYNKASKRHDNGSYQATVQYHCFQLLYGFDLFERKHFSLYPFAGLKGWGLTYMANQIADSGLTFNQYIYGPSLAYREVNYQLANFQAGLGASITGGDLWSEAEHILDLRFGFLIPSGANHTYTNFFDNKLTGAPFPSQTFYLTITYGFGKSGDDD